MDASVDIAARETALLGELNALMPGIDAGFGPHPVGWLLAGSDDAPTARLHAEIAALYPSAGPAYATVRSWTMLVWQPAMVAVAAVHAHGLVLPVDRMSQQVAGGGVYGFRLPVTESSRGSVEAMVDAAAIRVRRSADACLAALDRVARVKPKIAHRLLADRILGTLVHLHARQPELGVCDHADRWLAASGLAGMSRLADVQLETGAMQPVLDRKACCLHYLCEPGVLCQSCPKQPFDLRMSRMRAYWSAQSAA